MYYLQNVTAYQANLPSVFQLEFTTDQIFAAWKRSFTYLSEVLMVALASIH